MEPSELIKIEQDVTITRKLDLFLREVSDSDKLVIKEIFDENVYQVTSKDIRGGIVLDIGANIGIFSIYASLLGAKKVIAYEPEEDNKTVFEKNIKTNKFKNIEIRYFAVSGKDEEFEIYKAQGGSRRTNYAAADTDCPKQLVKAQSINKILAELDEIAVLKIDCEGGEYDIIEAVTSENLKKCIYITMEFHKTNEEIYGKMMAKLSLTHNVHVFGHFDQGGQLYARRY